MDHVNTLEGGDPAVARFENAVDAIVSGDHDTLRRMIEQYPELVHQRSTRAHRSTLLHYVSANGVEDHRQITPLNILEIATFLLDAGAEVDATSDAYGGGSTTLGLASTSAHPRARGVQLALIDLLLARGARIDGEHTLRGLVRGALANGCPEAAVALASRGARVNTLYAAAGVGSLERVQALFAGANHAAREGAFIVAAQQGHLAIVRFLLDSGVDVNASDGMTALHNACAGGHLALADLLIVRGADLEALNEYGGTVLSSTLWFAYHVNDQEFTARDFPRMIEFLIAAGARTDFYPELKDEIAGVSERVRRSSKPHQ
ncbi:MAG: ankyrin repeat domain-containing protein [Gemmatimonas sp.]